MGFGRRDRLSFSVIPSASSSWIVPLDASIVHGSHGLAAADPLDRPILIGHGPKPGDSVPMTDVRNLLLAQLGLA